MSLGTRELQPGQVVSHYRILQLIGEGGMGGVYLAEDLELHRNVALKVVRPGAGSTQPDSEALRKEGRAIAALNHPNIVSVFDLIEHEGRLIMVMEWIDGVTLTSRLGQVTPDELRCIAIELAAALAAAHQVGVIHGDIKPSNVIIGRDGRTRLLDFGIARRLEDSPAVTNDYSGTVPYMSPELLRGASHSPQSDLWALGILLYELATGTRPFRGDYEAAIQYAIMHTAAKPVRDVRPDLPEELAQVIDRLLLSNPGDRFTEIESLLSVLRGPKALQRAPRQSSARRYGILTVVVAAAAVVLFRSSLFGPFDEEHSDGRVIAVLPFVNLSDSTQEYFADGMTDAVISLLARDTQLSLISRPSVMQYRQTNLSLSDIALELSADYVVTGTIQRENSATDGQVRVSATLTDAASGRNVWGEVYDRKTSDLFQIQGRIAEDIRSALRLSTPDPELPHPATENLRAYDLYLRGNDYFNRSWSHNDIRIAIDMYGRAIDIDTSFAAAYAMLARGHASMFWEYFDRSTQRCVDARQAAETALKLNPTLADAHVAIGYYYYHCELDYLRALEAFHHALKLEPKNAEVLNAVAAVERRQGNLPMAAEHFAAALSLDPRSYLKAFDVGLTYGLMREYDQANYYLDRCIVLGPDFSLAHIYKAWLAILRNGDKRAAGDILNQAAIGTNLKRSHYYWWLQRIVTSDLETLLHSVTPMDDTAACLLFKSQINRLIRKADAQRLYADSARAWLEPRLANAPNAARYLSYLGLAYAGLGQKDPALMYSQKALEMLPASRDSFDALFLLINMAEILVVVGETDQAIAQIRNMLTLPGFVSKPYFLADPLWEPLRGLPEFQGLQAESL